MKYELLKVLKEGESYIKGEELIKRAKELNAASTQEDFDWFLAHQEEIPREWRDYYVVFADYTQRDCRGYLYVACLYFGGEQWDLSFRRLDGDWCGGGLFPRRKSGSFDTPESLDRKELIKKVLALESAVKEIKDFLVIC